MSHRRRKKQGGPRPPSRALRFDELAAIVERTKATLSAHDHATLKAAMDTLAFLTAELQTKQTSLHRLRRLLFGALRLQRGCGVGGCACGSSGGAAWEASV